jgi:hypothetical protein
MCDIVAADLPYISEPGELVYALGGIGLHVGGHAARAERPTGFHTAKNLTLVVRGEDRRFHAELCEHHALPQARPQDHRGDTPQGLLPGHGRRHEADRQAPRRGLGQGLGARLRQRGRRRDAPRRGVEEDRGDPSSRRSSSTATTGRELPLPARTTSSPPRSTSSTRASGSA